MVKSLIKKKEEEEEEEEETRTFNNQCRNVTVVSSMGTIQIKEMNSFFLKYFSVNIHNISNYFLSVLILIKYLINNIFGYCYAAIKQDVYKFVQFNYQSECESQISYQIISYRYTLHKV